MIELNILPTEEESKSVDNNKLKSPIFILGSGRSGTSLLWNILRNHPNIYCIPGETHLFSLESNPYIEELKIFQSTHDIENLTFTIISSILFGHECTALFAREKKFPKEVVEIYHELQDFILAVDFQEKYKIFNICISYITQKENKKRWLEKTPNNIFSLPQILSIYPDAKFVEIYRDPRAIFYSWKNAKQEYFKKTNIIECIKKWNTTFEYSKKYVQELPNQFYKIKYEDLLENLKVELINLCKFLNEDFYQSLLNTTIKSRTTWKDKLIKNELLLIDLTTKKYREELGYIDSKAKLDLINLGSFCFFYIRNKLFGRLNFHIEKLSGRMILFTNKSIAITNEFLQSILRKPYSLRRKFKTIYWVIQRKRKIKEYLNTHDIKKLHIGADPTMLKGWLNTNSMSITKEDIFLDASIRFPFDDNTFNYIFSEHQIEHLHYIQGLVMLKECLRVLKPGGKIRITTPNLESFINLYKNPREIGKIYIDYSIKRLFPELKENKEIFVLNNLFTNFGHKFIYDKNSLELNLKNVGFIDIEFHEVGTTKEEAFKNIEQHHKMFERLGFKDGDNLSKFDTIAVEASKP